MGTSVVAGGDAPPVLEPAEHALDEIATAIGGLAVGGRVLPALSGRDAGFDAAGLDGGAQRITIVSLVADQRPG